MASISQTTYSNAFAWIKIYELRFKFQFVPKGPINYAIIGSDNGAEPARQQAIVWTNDG